jgi:uncharacterized protein involved in exopolysaccharide biosynthesis
METIIKYLKVIIAYRKLIFYNVLIFTLAAIIITLILPKKYTASAKILPPSEDSEFIGALASSGLSLPRLSRMARAGGFFRSSTPSDLIGSILQSRTIAERVIERCDLKKVYKVKKGIEPAIKTLAKATEIKISEEGVVQLKVEAPKPQLSADIANTYIDELDRFLKESNMSRGKNMRIFVEERLADAENELRTAQESLKVFQERNKVVSLDEETRAVIDAYARLKSELLKREIELNVIKDLSTEDNPYFAQTRIEINEFNQRLAEIEKGESLGKGYGAGFSVPFQKLPEVAAEYARKLRDFRVQEEVYSILIQQYEQAKILEVRDTPNITILDYARVPERRSFPKHRVNVILAFIFSLLVSIIASFIIEYWRGIKLQNTQQYQDLKKIGEILKQHILQVKNFILRSKKGQFKPK